MSEAEYSVSDNGSPIHGEHFQFHQPSNSKKTQANKQMKNPKQTKKTPVASPQNVQLLPILRKKTTKPKNPLYLKTSLEVKIFSNPNHSNIHRITITLRTFIPLIINNTENEESFLSF